MTLPLDDTAGTNIHMIEEYASQEASDSHLQTPPVQELISLFSSGNVLASAPEVHNDRIVASKVAKAVPTISSNPALVIANFEYKPGTVDSAIEGWKEYVKYVQESEDGTKEYAVLATEGEGWVRTVDVYESWEFLDKVHINSEAIGKVKEGIQKNGTGNVNVVRVRVVDGFLGRDKGSAKI